MSGITSRRIRHETIAEWMARTDAEYAERSARPHYVYRAFDEFGMLLYIGCTVDVEKRLGSHRSSSQWHRYMVSHTVEAHPDMASGRAAERHAIDNEAAFFNATQADIRRTQANRNAARRMLHDAGIYQPTSHHLGLPPPRAHPTSARTVRRAVRSKHRPPPSLRTTSASPSVRSR